MEKIMFKRTALALFAIITAPGKYLLTNYSDVTERNLVDGKYITTLKAIPADKLGQVKEVFGKENAVEIEKTNGLFLTTNIWDRPGVRLPGKGEVVEATVGYVKSRTGEDVLRVTALSVPKAQEATKFDLAIFNEEATVQAAASEMVETH